MARETLGSSFAGFSGRDERAPSREDAAFAAVCLDFIKDVYFFVVCRLESLRTEILSICTLLTLELLDSLME